MRLLTLSTLFLQSAAPTQQSNQVLESKEINLKTIPYVSYENTNIKNIYQNTNDNLIVKKHEDLYGSLTKDNITQQTSISYNFFKNVAASLLASGLFEIAHQLFQ